ncbi:hypothetical protein T10_9863 [Trichinella papuae]|uniref:Uncharacterized protein n=1 Tax=Trichinella papuae TaxID=268474 RepID=A0A0V1MWG1_9BILA|nr:hypothetical protein T10_9863 [Trichinella papuae]
MVRQLPRSPDGAAFVVELLGSREASDFHNKLTDYHCPPKSTNSSNLVNASSDLSSLVDGRIPTASTSQNCLISGLLSFNGLPHYWITSTASFHESAKNLKISIMSNQGMDLDWTGSHLN